MPVSHAALLQDPIECIANRLAHHCFWALQQVAAIEFVTNQYDTDAKAMGALVAQGLSTTTDPANLKLLINDAPQLRRCIVNLSAIKSLARKVFEFNFSENAQPFVFKQEICFSYACKFLVAIGPLLEHFSNRPNRIDIINAELALALRTPIFTEEDIGRRKTSLSAPAQVSLIAEEGHELPRYSASPSPTLATVDLTCHETLTPPLWPTPAARQTPPAHLPRPRRSCRR